MPDFKNTVGGRFLTMLEAQAPANFAMVMSTGIVSVALHLLDYPIGARLLFCWRSCTSYGCSCFRNGSSKISGATARGRAS